MKDMNPCPTCVALPLQLLQLGAASRWLAVAITLGLVATATSADVAAYRGPQNNGVYEETGLLKAWPTDGPKLLWKQPLKSGYSGPSVVGGTVWIPSGGGAVLYGFDLETGVEKAKIPIGGAGSPGGRFPGPRQWH